MGNITKEEFLSKHQGNENVTKWAEENYETFNSELNKVNPEIKRYQTESSEYGRAAARIYSNSEGNTADVIDNLFLKIELEELGGNSVKNGLEQNKKLLGDLNSIGPTDALDAKIQALIDYEELNSDLSVEELQDIQNAKTSLSNLINSKGAIRTSAQKLSKLDKDLQKALKKDGQAVTAQKGAMDEGYGSGIETKDGESKEDALARRTAALKSTKDAFTISNVQNNTSITFKEQCFLQANIVELIKIKRNILESSTPRKVPYAFDGKNKALNIEGDPYGFMNKLTQPASTSALFLLPNTVLSQLQPHVRLYKVVFDDNGKEQREVPIEFPSHFGQDVGNISSFLKTSKRRGHGVGLKSFNFSYEGSDPFAVKKSIKASLEIFAASFEEILDDRGGYSYSDLALKTGTSDMRNKVKQRKASETIDANLSKLNFRLKAIVGYSYPKNLVIPSNSNLDSAQIKKAIYNSFVTLNLTPTIHEFDFDDSGRLNFKINYLAYVEDFFDQAYFNIFSDVRATKNTFRRSMLLKYYKENCQLENIKSLKSEEKKGTDLEIKNSMQTLLGGLFEDGHVYALNIPYSDLYNASSDPLYELASIEKIGEIPGALDAPEPVVEEATSTSDPDAARADTSDASDAANAQWDVENQVPSSQASSTYEQVAFFFLDDLVDVMMGFIDESLSEDGYQKVVNQMQQEGVMSARLGNEEKTKLAKNSGCFKKLRLILGPVELRNPKNANEFMQASLGDIPISAKYFVEWMTSKVLSKGRVYYSISKFINDFVKHYLRNFLNDDRCYGQATKQRITFYSANITSYPDHGTGDAVDEITKLIAENGMSSDSYTGRLNINNVNASGVLNTMGRRNDPRGYVDGGEMNYMVFFAGRSHPKDKQQGSYVDDTTAGVFHYLLGKDSGVVKNIKLDRTTITGLKEVRFEQEGFDGLEQLREVYDVSIDTFAMPTTYPGTYIFVDPRGFAPESKPFDGSDGGDSAMGPVDIELTKFGIGGYFMIIRSETTLREGLAETKVSAKWVSGMGSDTTEAGEADAEIESNPGIMSAKKCKAETKTEIPPTPRGAGAGTPEDTVGTNPMDMPDPGI